MCLAKLYKGQGNIVRLLGILLSLSETSHNYTMPQTAKAALSKGVQIVLVCMCMSMFKNEKDECSVVKPGKHAEKS